MPTYEYTCRDCGHTFDIVQKMTDEPLTVCPNCGGRLRKVFAVPAIAFKGSGFYATDHGKKAKRPDEGSDKGKPDKDAKKPAASSDGKGHGSATKDGSAAKKESTSSASGSSKDGKGS
jgi:putative FmdB family regulatory protein